MAIFTFFFRVFSKIYDVLKIDILCRHTLGLYEGQGKGCEAFRRSTPLAGYSSFILSIQVGAAKYCSGGRKFQAHDLNHISSVSFQYVIEIYDAIIQEQVTHFVKIHAPFDELCDIAEDMKMKMPIQENDVVIKTWLQKNLPSAHELLKKSDPFIVRGATVKEEPNFFVATFDKARLGEFIGSANQDEFFSPAERSRFVLYSLVQ